ncbi:MAG: hypothetical protein II453_14365 [Alphaproteobacteria bacterium]|nr:hypothetical protein [Alphaproteobacteria bacterium]
MLCLLWLADEEKRHTTQSAGPAARGMLWLAGEEKRHTTVLLLVVHGEVLWLAGEEKKYTTGKVFCGLDFGLWLAIEENQLHANTQNGSQSCGLLLRRKDILHDKSRKCHKRYYRRHN